MSCFMRPNTLWLTFSIHGACKQAINQSINQGFYSRWGQLAHLTELQSFIRKRNRQKVTQTGTIIIRKLSFCMKQTKARVHVFWPVYFFFQRATRHDFRRQKLDKQRTMFTTKPFPFRSIAIPLLIQFAALPSPQQVNDAHWTCVRYNHSQHRKSEAYVTYSLLPDAGNLLSRLPQPSFLHQWHREKSAQTRWPCRSRLMPCRDCHRGLVGLACKAYL